MFKGTLIAILSFTMAFSVFAAPVAIAMPGADVITGNFAEKRDPMAVADAFTKKRDAMPVAEAITGELAEKRDAMSPVLDARDGQSAHDTWGKRATKGIGNGWGKRANKGIGNGWGKRANKGIGNGWGKRANKGIGNGWGKRDN